MAERRRKLAIVGAGARAAAQSAVRGGFEVVAADLFADADLRACCAATQVDRYPEGLADWLVASDCDAWMYTGALENYPELVDRMAADRPLLGNCGDELRAVRDPLKLQTALTAAGLAFPETRQSADDLPLDGSWLAKTYRGSSGSGVWRLDGEAAETRARSEGAVFQRLVPGEAAAVVFSCASAGVQLLGVTRQIVGGSADRPWQYVGSIGPLVYSDHIAARLAMLGDVLTRGFYLRGIAGVDLVLEGDRTWIIEINPRYTASIEILERAAGVSAIAAHVAACSSNSLAGAADFANRSVEPSPMHTKSILYAPADVRPSAAFLRWALEQAQLQRAKLADIPASGELIPAGRPVLTAFATGATAAECLAELEARLAEVQSRLYDGT